MAAKIACRKIAAPDALALRTDVRALWSVYLPGARTCRMHCGTCRPALPLRRWFVLLLLCLRRQRKAGHDRNHGNGDL
jgi:hypothetical protein